MKVLNKKAKGILYALCFFYYFSFYKLGIPYNIMPSIAEITITSIG